MPERDIETAKERMTVIAGAAARGMLEAVLAKRKELLALPDEELAKLVEIMKGLGPVAANDCCTGG